MGEYRDGAYVAQFVVERPLAQVWAQLEPVAGAPTQWLRAWPCMPADGPVGEVLEVNAPHSVRAAKTSEPCKDSEIGVVLDAVSTTATRVNVRQSNVPAWVEQALAMFIIGGDQIVADLALFLDQGVLAGRHSMPWAFPGITAATVPAGLQVTGVLPGCFGERAGLQVGDVLVAFGGAPLVTQQCLQTVCRVLQPGSHTKVTWVRDGMLREATAPL